MLLRFNAGDLKIVQEGADVSADDIVIALDDLTDVSTVGAADGKILKYNSGQWQVADDAGGGIDDIVEDLTPQLGGPLDLNSQLVTGEFQVTSTPTSSGQTTHILSTSMTGLPTNQENTIANLIIEKKNAGNATRNVYWTTRTESGGTTRHLTLHESRWNGTYKTHQIYPTDDAGTVQTQWQRLRYNPSTGENFNDVFGKFEVFNQTTSNTLFTVEQGGQINQTVNGTTEPNSMNMFADLEVADTIHNFLTSIGDYGTGTTPNGAQMTHTFKVDGSAGDQSVGRLEFTYDTTEANNKAALRSDNHAGTQQGELSISGVQAESTLPFKLPSYTVATLPTNVGAGAQAYCTDETGGAVPVFYDGTDWRRVTDRTVAS